MTDEEAVRLEAENAKLKALVDRLKMEAQVNAQEARTANATIYEIYQVASGGTGELGNWHGADPVRKAIGKLKAEVNQLKAELAEARYMRENAESALNTHMEIHARVVNELRTAQQPREERETQP